MRCSALVLFNILWSLLIYSPIAHWVWHPNGWIFALGALDFAGGTVVHISSGVTALVCALVLGKRLGYGKIPMPPHSLVLGTPGRVVKALGEEVEGFHRAMALKYVRLKENYRCDALKTEG